MSGTTATVDFTPPSKGTFSFPVTLTGATVNVSSSSADFTVVVYWNTFGQRWYFNIVDQNGVLVVARPLIGSPPGYPISLTAGYFETPIVFLEASQQFVVG